MTSPTDETPWKFSVSPSDPDLDALVGNTQWAVRALTYSFAGPGSAWSTAPQSQGGYGLQGGGGEPWASGAAALNAAQQQAVRSAVASWQAVANLSLSEVTDSETVAGDLRFGFTNVPDILDAQAYAYSPGTGPVAGDVWFNREGTSWTETTWVRGGWEYQTAVHEIGHALGLEHPFETPGFDPTLDSRSFTIMSYSAEAGNQDTYFSHEPTTPMVLDIAAIQHMYGRNTTTNAGNTNHVYALGGTYHETIWDAGGNDTLTYDSTWGGDLDLRQGVAYGSALGQVVSVQDAFGNDLYAVYNVWIAYGTVIENAVGGTGDDTIWGNGAANGLSGRAGADILRGFAGNDTLTGGLGNDTLEGGTGRDTYRIDAAGDVVTETSTLAGEIDTVISTVSRRLGDWQEWLTLTGSAASGTGNGLANRITGNGAANLLGGAGGADTLDGAGGHDSLAGGDGNDSLLGGTGNDTLNGGGGADRATGGSGADQFRFVTAPVAGTVDRIADFVAADDAIVLENALFAGIGPAGALAAGAFRAGVTAGDGGDRILYDVATGRVWFDADGTGATAAILFANVGAGTVLGAADFIVI